MEDLVQEIRDTFANVPYPGHSKLGTDEMIVAFRGVHWTEVTPELLAYRSAEITSFTPEAFRFYLPAMMIGVLVHQGEINILNGTLIYCLVFPEGNSIADDYWHRQLTRIIELLTLAEKRVVYKFLLKCKAMYPTEGWDYSVAEEDKLDEVIRFWATLVDNLSLSQNGSTINQ